MPNRQRTEGEQMPNRRSDIRRKAERKACAKKVYEISKYPVDTLWGRCYIYYDSRSTTDIATPIVATTVVINGRR